MTWTRESQVQFSFPPPLPVFLDTGLAVVTGVAVPFVLLTRFACPVGKPKFLRVGLLTAVALSVFVFGAIAGDIIVDALNGSRVATWPVTAWLILIAALLATGVAKYRGRYDISLRRTLLISAGLAFGLSLAPRSGSARSAVQSGQCKQNLKTIGKAFGDRAEKEGRYPPAVDRSPDQPPSSWRVTLLSGISDNVQSGYDSSQPWDAAANLRAAQTEIAVYSCPSVGYPRDDQSRWLSSYALVTGPGTIFPGGTSLKVKEITDGTSNTLLAVEAPGLGIVWSEPRDFDVSQGPLGFNLPGTKFGRSPGLLSSYHSDCVNVLFADGSARLLSGKVDRKVLKALTTAAGHDKVELPMN